jgi:hypothetical protein
MKWFASMHPKTERCEDQLVRIGNQRRRCNPRITPRCG